MNPSATIPNELRTISEDMEIDINEVEELRVCETQSILNTSKFILSMLKSISWGS